MDTIVNKVAQSGIVTLDLSEYLMDEKMVAAFDLKPFLFREMILKEKEFRAALPSFDWEQYDGKHVAIFCSVDAILPVWALMLAASFLQPVAKSVYLGSVEEMKKYHLLSALSNIDATAFSDQRVVIKGCGDTPVPEAAYVAITAMLRPHVKSLMYGEPCSTVPLYKRK